MRRVHRTVATVIVMTVACLCVQSSPARAEEGDTRSTAERSFAIGIDVLVVRPLGAIAVATGFAFFLPAALLTSPNGKDAIHQAFEKLVLIPTENTFQRPIGDF